MSEELNQEAAKECSKNVQAMMHFLCGVIDEYPPYTKINMIMNTITGCLNVIMNSLPDDGTREVIIKGVNESLTRNLHHYREMKQ